MRKFLCAMVVAVALAGLGQAATAARPAIQQQQKPAADSAIERRIQAKFAKSKINAEHFTVSVHNGVAVIDGKTNVIQHKGVATRLAKSGGAVAVQNHIQISAEAKAKALARLQKNQGAPATGQLAHATVIPPPSK